MDYKTLVHDFNQNKKELVEFISLRNKRNIDRSEEMVENYLVQMATGDYSIKSYKAKIIHNELDCNHAIRDIEEVKAKTIDKMETLFSAYFDEYLDSRIDESFEKQKAKDMRDYVNENRKQKHDVLLKKNNIEKDFNQKSKELDVEKKEKLNSYNEKINSLKMRLVNDLKRLNEKTIKDYSEFELALLDNDNKDDIKELKEKIKEIRRASLDEEYKIKMDTYDEILNEELTFTKSYQEFIYELEKYRKEMQERLAELERDNELLTIDSDYQDKLYDEKFNKKVNDTYLNEIKKLENLIKYHNEFVSKDYNEHSYDLNEKMFIYDLASLHLYKLLVKIHKDSRTDVLGNFISFLLSLIEQEKASYLAIFNEMKPLRDKEVEELTVALDGFVPNPKKKLTKEELVSNVIESLDRYFENYNKELEFYNTLYSDFIFSIVKTIEDGYNAKVNTNDEGLILDNVSNYSYVDLEKYGYKKEEEVVEVPSDAPAPLPKSVVIENNIKSLLSDYTSNYEVENEKIVGKMNELNSKKESDDALLQKTCEDKVATYNKEYTETIEKNKKELLEKEKEVTKGTSKSKDKAKKLLLESKKAL